MKTVLAEQPIGEEFTLTEKLESSLATGPETPILAVDLEVIAARYIELRHYFPAASIYYAVKANPAPEVVALLEKLGARFDVASRPELDMCLGLGVHPARLSYGNTIEKSADIAYAFVSGVPRFAFDSEAALRKQAVQAPSCEVVCRLQTTGIFTMACGEVRKWSITAKWRKSYAHCNSYGVHSSVLDASDGPIY